MRIAIGSDHAGFEDPPPYYKPELTEFVRNLGHEVMDCGTDGPESVDYPDFAREVARSVQQGDADMGIIICGTGMGVCMAANRLNNIRAAVAVTPEMARLAREHNNANILCLGRRVLGLDDCKKLAEIFLNTPFEGHERHQRRIGKIG